ncbi:hypothetical protein PR202_gb27280 [Eleusine coracana subsp. coracana]|uniref:Uncharacterized protein n=1 Tax=Eleusine coracana subsp. coracana TaxID=191504 RepID=A0AAV5FTU3_ELECO|nr:hypothetical protein PR202_gb27280 [Eleusine coracana subsp. coracana]
MKVKTICRSTDDFTRERSQDLQIFAKPFIGAMDGHIDAVSCMAKNSNYLKAIVSGSMDGDIRLWDIGARKTVCQFPGHQGAVRGLTTSTDGDLLVSCGVDCTISLSLAAECIVEFDSGRHQCLKWLTLATKLEMLPRHALDNNNFFLHFSHLPSVCHLFNPPFWFAAISSLHLEACILVRALHCTTSGVDHQWDGNLFATVGAQVDIWDPNRSEPINCFEWGKDTVLSVRFDPGDCNLLITSASDRSLTLYDLRTSSPARKLIMKTRCNSVCWNPREPMNFTAVRIKCLFHYSLE